MEPGHLTGSSSHGYARVPVFVGREREQNMLRQSLEEMLAGHGSLVLISGDAGFGKTALLQSFLENGVAEHALVLTGHCYDLSSTRPYGPWLDLTDRYRASGDLPELPEVLRRDTGVGDLSGQLALFEVALDFFRSIAQQRPLVLVLEDAHWSDQASLDLLLFIARQIARQIDNHQLLLIVTYRDDEVTRHHPLFQLVPLLARESVTERIDLRPLDEGHVRTLIAGRYSLAAPDEDRLVRYLQSHAEGHPLFLQELLRTIEDENLLRRVEDGWIVRDLDRVPIPRLVQQVIEGRIDRLGGETRRLLQLAAVIGQEVPLDAWQAVGEVDDESLIEIIERSVEAHLLQESDAGTGVRFSHALIRETLYASVLVSRRRRWHRQIADLMIASPNPDPDAVAYHLQQAGDPRAAEWLIQAGARAERSYALHIAASHYAAAEALLEADGNRNTTQARGWLLLHIGHLLRYSDQIRSLAYLEEATHVALQIDDKVLAAYSQQYHGLACCLHGDVGAGLREMENAIRTLDRATRAQETEISRVLSALFPQEILSHPSVAARGTFFMLGRLPGINTLTHTYVGWLASAGRFHEAMRIGEGYVRQVAEATSDALLIQDACRDAYLGLAAAASWLGRPGEARRWRALALDAYEAIGHRTMVRNVRHNEFADLLTYDTDKIVARQRAAMVATAKIEGVEDHKAGGIGGIRVGALLDLIEGQWEQAREIVCSTRGEHDTHAQFIRASIYQVLGREQEDEQFTAAVWADIHDVLPDGPATDMGQKHVRNTVIAQQLAADLALAAGDQEAARDWIAAHDRWLAWSDAVLGRAEGQLLWARYHWVASDLSTARHHAERALGHARDPRQPLALIAAHRALGQLGAAAERFDQAREHLQASLELAERCEAPYEQALSMLELAELAAASGAEDEARQLLSEVGAVCEALGAQRTLDRVSSLEGELEEQALAGTPAFGLTPRELEVLQAVAEGLTDTEAGERLYISTRTVSHHLRSIYIKLEINNRTAAVRMAMEHDLV